MSSGVSAARANIPTYNSRRFPKHSATFLCLMFSPQYAFAIDSSIDLLYFGQVEVGRKCSASENNSGR
jgi:hypothetical protein